MQKLFYLCNEVSNEYLKMRVFLGSVVFVSIQRKVKYILKADDTKAS
jgi:hypothetical protein